MMLTLAIIGALAVLAIVFRLSGITGIRGAVEISRNDKETKQLDK